MEKVEIEDTEEGTGDNINSLSCHNSTTSIPIPGTRIRSSLLAVTPRALPSHLEVHLEESFSYHLEDPHRVVRRRVGGTTFWRRPPRPTESEPAAARPPTDEKPTQTDHE